MPAPQTFRKRCPFLRHHPLPGDAALTGSHLASCRGGGAPGSTPSSPFHVLLTRASPLTPLPTCVCLPGSQNLQHLPIAHRQMCKLFTWDEGCLCVPLSSPADTFPLCPNVSLVVPDAGTTVPFPTPPLKPRISPRFQLVGPSATVRCLVWLSVIVCLSPQRHCHYEGVDCAFCFLKFWPSTGAKAVLTGPVGWCVQVS